MSGRPVRLAVDDLAALEADRAAGRAHDSPERLEGRALAASVGAEDHGDLAAPHVERHAVQDLHATVRRPELPDVEQHRPQIPMPLTARGRGRGALLDHASTPSESWIPRLRAETTSRSSGSRTAPRPLPLTEVRLDDGRIPLDNGGGADSDDATMIQHGDRIRDAHHQVHVVADQEHRGARLPDPRDQLCEAGDLLLREPGRRLVEQQHRGPPCERAGELNEPLVAERQIPRQLVRVAPVADEREEPARLHGEPRLARAHRGKTDERGGQRARAAARETDHHVLEDGHRLEEVRGLKRPADPRARDPVGREPREGARPEVHHTRRRTVVPAQDVEQRGLPGAVGPDEAVDAPREEREIAGGERGDTAEVYLEPAGVERRSLPRPRPPRPRRRVVRGRSQARALHESAHHAARQEVDAAQEQCAVHHKPVVGEPVQDLGKNDEHTRPHDGPRHAAEAAEKDDQEEKDRGLQREAVRAHKAGEERVEAPARGGERGAQRERHRPNEVGTEPERLRRDVAVPDGAERPPPRRPAEIVCEREAHEDGESDDVVVARERERQARERGARDVGDPAEPARKPVPFDQAVLDDDAEGDRHHREVGPGDTQRGQAQDGADDDPDSRRQREREPEGEPAARRDDRAGVSAERVEAGLPERHLPRGAGEHVEPRRDHDADADQDRDEEIVRVAGAERDRRGDDEDERAGDPQHG